MSGFSDARSVERRGMMVLEPFLRETSDNGQYVLVSKGPLARHIQQEMGDAFINRNGRFLAVEVKIEQRPTGNLFLEVWSNRNLEDKESHAERGCNPGWMFKLRADLLFYYFLESDELYIIDMFSLKRWAFGHGDKPGSLLTERYKERPQSRYSQMNDTWGRLVPVSDIIKHVSCRKVYAKQFSMDLGDAA